MRIKRCYILTAVLVAFCLLTTIPTAATPGDLDLTFGSGGIVRTSAGGTSGWEASAMAIQSDGKIVVVGDGSYDWCTCDFAVARYNTDGSLDSSFGGNALIGRVMTDVRGLDHAASVAIQPDGKIVVAGSSRTGLSYQESSIAIVRYNPNGSLDTSFGGTGVIITSTGNSNIAATSVKIQSDGKIIAAGYSGDYPYSGVSANGDFAAVRYNTDGSLDVSFGSTGIVITDVGGLGDSAASAAIQSDDKLVVAGSSARANGGSDFAVVRLNQNGSLDTTFNGTGRVITPIAGDHSYAASVAVQTDGKIIVAGTSGEDLGFVRYLVDGSLDTSFGGTGIVITDVGGLTDYAASMAIQPDGKIVAAGSSSVVDHEGHDFAVVRLDQNGSPDTTFNGTGRVITRIAGFYDWATSVAIQADGKIVVTGAGDYGGDLFNNFAVVRYLAVSVPGVAVSGRVTTPSGQGLRNATVSITNSQGVQRTVTTSSFGFYSFANNPTGATYTISVASRLYRFTPRTLTLNENLADIDFMGLE